MSGVLDTPAPTGDRADGDTSTDGSDGAIDGRPAEAPGHESPGAAVLAGLAVPGLDLDEARHLVGVRAARRLRRRRAVLGGAAAFVAVGLAVVLWPQADPQEINADGDREVVTTTTTPPATVPAPVETTVVVTTVAPTTTAAPVVTTVPTTTVPPNRTMTVTATLRGTNGVATAGEAVVLDVAWSDPDLPAGTPVDVVATFGDPLVTRPIVAAGAPPCDAPGPGASGTRQLPFRYATAGQLTIQVEVTACGGTGAYGELKTVQVPVDVRAPAAGRRVVVVGGGDGRDPDAAEIIAGTEIVAQRSVPDLVQVLPDGTTRATVATNSDAFAGDLYLRWGTPPDASCQVTGPPPLAPGVDPVTALLAPGLVSCDQAGATTSTSTPSTRP